MANVSATIMFICVVLCPLLGAAAAISGNGNERYLRRLSQSQHAMSSLRTTLDDMDVDLRSQQKRTCAVGINSHHCSLATIDNYLNVREWLRSGDSPGKRLKRSVSEFKPYSVGDSDSQNDYSGNSIRARRDLNDLASKRSLISTVKRLLTEAEKYIRDEKKRTCRVNLGGQCQTQFAAELLDQMDYLNSAMSPGRRKRSKQIEQATLVKIPAPGNIEGSR